MPLKLPSFGRSHKTKPYGVCNKSKVTFYELSAHFVQNFSQQTAAKLHSQRPFAATPLESGNFDAKTSTTPKCWSWSWNLCKLNSSIDGNPSLTLVMYSATKPILYLENQHQTSLTCSSRRIWPFFHRLTNKETSRPAHVVQHRSCSHDNQGSGHGHFVLWAVTQAAKHSFPFFCWATFGCCRSGRLFF